MMLVRVNNTYTKLHKNFSKTVKIHRLASALSRPMLGAKTVKLICLRLTDDEPNIHLYV